MITVHQWGDLTSPELAQIATHDPVALLLIAATEQHGPHLPLSTDYVIGNGILRAACERLSGMHDGTFDLLIMPALPIGASLEHTHFAGTISLESSQMMAWLRVAGEAVARAGIRRLLVFNSHGGNPSVLNEAALQLRATLGLLVVKVNYFRCAPPPGLIAPEELAHGLHGGALETSIMLHLAPHQVRLERLEDFVPLGLTRQHAGLTLGPSGVASFAWMAQDLHPEGVAGNAASASARTGECLVDHYASQLARAICETAQFDLATLGKPPAK